MNVNLDIPTIIRSLQQFIKRFHSIIFFTILGGLLITGSIFVLFVINNGPLPEVPPEFSDSFDQETIDKVEQLDPSELYKPTGRSNPFIE